MCYAQTHTIHLVLFRQVGRRQTSGYVNLQATDPLYFIVQIDSTFPFGFDLSRILRNLSSPQIICKDSGAASFPPVDNGHPQLRLLLYNGIKKFNSNFTTYIFIDYTKIVRKQAIVGMRAVSISKNRPSHHEFTSPKQFW